MDAHPPKHTEGAAAAGTCPLPGVSGELRLQEQVRHLGSHTQLDDAEVKKVDEEEKREMGEDAAELDEEGAVCKEIEEEEVKLPFEAHGPASSVPSKCNTMLISSTATDIGTGAGAVAAETAGTTTEWMMSECGGSAGE